MATNLKIIVLVVTLIFSLVSCKVFLQSESGFTVVKDANTELYKTAEKKSKILDLIFRVRDEMLKNIDVDNDTIVLMHDEAIIYGSTRMVSLFVTSNERLIFYTDTYTGNTEKIEKSKYSTCMEDYVLKYLWFGEKEQFIEELKSNHPIQSHASIFYISVLSLKSNQVISTSIIESSCQNE